MRTVLDVSTVVLWGAEAYFVVATPEALKKAILMMMPIDDHLTSADSFKN